MNESCDHYNNPRKADFMANSRNVCFAADSYLRSNGDSATEVTAFSTITIIK